MVQPQPLRTTLRKLAELGPWTKLRVEPALEALIAARVYRLAI